MRKRFIALLMIIAVMTAALPLVAHADTSGSSASVDVSFELSETDLTPPSNTDGDDDYSEPVAPPAGTYQVMIPSSIVLNYEQSIVLNARNVQIPDTARLVVSIDGSKTFPDGAFYLICGDGNASCQRVVCNLLRGSSSDFSVPPSEVLTGPEDAVVATFRNGQDGADTYGWLQFSPSYTMDNVVGVYTGTVHFKIAIVNE